MTAKALPGGGDIAKTGVEALNVDNLGKTLPFLQSLSPKADSLGILGNIVTQKQNESKIARELEAEKAKQAFEIRKTILGSRYATPELLKQEYSNLSGSQGSILQPVSTEQSMQPATELFKEPESKDITTQLGKATLEEKITKSQQAKTEKSLQPLYNQLTNKITEAVMANDFDRLNRISAQSSTDLSGSKDLQDKISKQVADATNTVINRVNNMSNTQFNQAMSQANLETRQMMMQIQAQNKVNADIQKKADKEQAKKDRNADKLETRKQINRSSLQFQEAKEGYDAAKLALNIYNSDPSVAGIKGLLQPGGIRVGLTGQFKSAIDDAIDLKARKRTGAVIKDSEMKLYNNMFKPSWLNDPANQRSKLNTLVRAYEEVLRRLENPDRPAIDLNSIYNQEILKGKKQVTTTQKHTPTTNKVMQVGRFKVEVQ
jgi:hypothetical protein